MVINAINGAVVPNPVKGKVEHFTNLSNEEVLYLAQNKALCDGQTRKQQDMTKALTKAVPIVDSMVAVSEKSNALGLAGVGSLSASLGTFAARLTSWAFFLGAFDIADKLIDRATKKSQKLTEIDEKHPLLKPLAELAVIAVAYSGGKKYSTKLKNLIPDSIKNKVLVKLNGLKNTIDASKISKKIYEPMMNKLADGALKHPKMTALAKSMKPMVVPALILASLFKSAVIDPLIYSKKVKNNFDSIKTQQEGIKTIMDISNQKLGGY